MHTVEEAKPFLKWAGGKARLLHYLVQCIPPHFKTYYEPFLGGGAFFFRLHAMGKITHASISDLNKDLMNCYVVIRDNMDALVSRLDHFQEHVSDKAFFYRVARPSFNKIPLQTGLDGHVEKAALLFYLNKTCYNGLYRVNSEGEFNVPWGRYDRPILYDERNLRKVHEILTDHRIEIKCCDYREAVETARGGDFIYFDPPYQPLSSTSNFTQYTPETFTSEDQKRLASTFRGLDGRGGCYVVLSNSYSPLIEQLYQDYISRGYLIIAKAARFINCVGEGRRPIPEYIIYNFTVTKLDEYAGPKGDRILC